MNQDRFREITGRYAKLRIAVVGDYFLDRYLLIDPSKSETSIETGLPVHHVKAVRSQPGAAGTIVNNLVALGIGEIHALGFCGEDGEGFELRKTLRELGVHLDHFLTVETRRTPVYCKPLIVEEGKPPRELSRFDSKNETETPIELQRELAERLRQLIGQVDAVVLMDQVDQPETGVVTRLVVHAAHDALGEHPQMFLLADSRRGLIDYPPIGFKMNVDELSRMTGMPQTPDLGSIRDQVRQLAGANQRPVFVTLANRGIIGAMPDRPAEWVPALPVHGPIDVVGAGDSVTANLITALASGAEVREALRIAMAAASIVVHQLGTTGTASVLEIADRLIARPDLEGVGRS